MIGKTFGAWTVTQATKLTHDDLGCPQGGTYKLVNQDTLHSFEVRHDGALRAAEYFCVPPKGVALGRHVSGRSPTSAIRASVKQVDQALLNSVA